MSGNQDFSDRLSGPASATAFKAPVMVATTASITLYGAQTIDGVAVVAADNNGNPGDRVLVKNQASSIDNGIYNVQAAAWTRATDWDGNRDAMDGSLVFTAHGTTNINKIWKAVCSADTFINVGVDAVTFSSIN